MLHRDLIIYIMSIDDVDFLTCSNMSMKLVVKDELLLIATIKKR